MAQVWQLVLCVALLHGAVLAVDFTPAQVEAAREALGEALDQTVAKLFANMDEVDMPPYIRQTTRTVAFVPVETIKTATEVKMSKMSTLRRDGTLGLDPVVAGKTIPFTLPLKLDHPELTGLFTRKVNGVGPVANFTTTFGVLRLEAEGTATMSPDACSFTITSVKDIEVKDVSTEVENASVLNGLFSSKVTESITEKKFPIGESVSRIVLAKLQENAVNGNDCTANLREHLKKAPAA